MRYKRNGFKGRIANAKVNKLPQKQSSQGAISKGNKDFGHIGGLAQLSRTQARNK